MGRFDRQEQLAIPDGGRVERAEPARAASFVADVGVPMAQAAVSGGILAGLLTWGVSELGGGVEPVRFFLFFWLAFGGAAWFVVLLDGRRLLWRLETWIGQDLDGDRLAGEPQERVVVVGAPRAQAQAREQAQQAEMSQFRDFVRRLDTLGTSGRVWEPRLGRDRYQEYRAILLKMGWAEWVSVKSNGRPNVRQGWRLAVPVETILEKISD